MILPGIRYPCKFTHSHMIKLFILGLYCFATITASSLRDLVTEKYPGLLDENAVVSHTYGYLSLEGPEKGQFLDFVEAIGLEDQNYDPELIETFVFSFTPEICTCPISRAIFEKCLDMNLPANFIGKMAAFAIMFDQEEAFDQLYEKYSNVLQKYENENINSVMNLSEAVLSKTLCYKYAYKMINAGFEFPNPKKIVEHICSLQGCSSTEYQDNLKFVRFLVKERGLVDPAEIEDINGILSDVLRD